MPHLASWVRESDAPYLPPLLAGHPEIRVRNARVEPVDLETADGLLVTGGPDIAAEFHPEPPRDPALILDPEPVRDAWEFAALRRALARGLPVLCICKGTQVLNVALGGSLHLDIPGHGRPEQRDGNIQALRTDARARHRFERVNSSHHQALDRVGDGLEIEAWCAADDVIEQVRLRDYPWCVGTQYHPERDPVLYAPLFADFFAAVQDSAARASTR